jgi:hypothetical protein
MQAMNVGNDNDTAMVPAQTLREMTISQAVISKRQKDSIMDSFMSSMVRIATEQGGNGYSAKLQPTFDPTLLAEISNEFQTLGYTVTTEQQVDPTVGPFLLMTISW